MRHNDRMVAVFADGTRLRIRGYSGSANTTLVQFSSTTAVLSFWFQDHHNGCIDGGQHAVFCGTPSGRGPWNMATPQAPQTALAELQLRRWRAWSFVRGLGSSVEADYAGNMEFATSGEWTLPSNPGFGGRQFTAPTVNFQGRTLPGSCKRAPISGEKKKKKAGSFVNIVVVCTPPSTPLRTH